MKDFFTNYWREILYVVCALVSVVLFIVKKKPVKVVDTIKETICRLLPYCILEAEKEINFTAKPRTSVDKKQFALSLLWKLLAELVSVSGDDLAKIYHDFASEQVEVILTTPQKKAR